jgi:hypothetical protein
MWLPTREDAVAIYARFCLSHYGANAREKVCARAEQLGRSGDADGEKIWREVAHKIEHEIERAPPHGREFNPGFRA